MLRAAILATFVFVIGCSWTFEVHGDPQPPSVAILVHRQGGVHIDAIDGEKPGKSRNDEYEIAPGAHRLTLGEKLGKECLYFEAIAGGRYELREHKTSLSTHGDVVDLSTGREISTRSSGKCEDQVMPVGEVAAGNASATIPPPVHFMGCMFSEPLGNGWSVDHLGSYWKGLAKTKDFIHGATLTLDVGTMTGIRDQTELVERARADLARLSPQALVLEVAADSTLGVPGVRYHVRYLGTRDPESGGWPLKSLWGVRAMHPHAHEVAVSVSYSDEQIFKKEDAAKAAVTVPEPEINSQWETFRKSLAFIQPAPGILSSDTLGHAQVEGLVTGFGSVWVPRQINGDLIRIDAANGHIIARIPIGRAELADVWEGGEPSNVAVGADAVWAINSAEATVYRIDPVGNKKVASIRVGKLPMALAVEAGSVWVLDGKDGALSRIDTADNQVHGKPIKTERSATGILADRGLIWVGGGYELIRIDPSTKDPARKEISLNNVSLGLVAGAGSLWVFCPVSTLLRIDPDNGAVLASFIIPSGSSGIAFGHDRLWVCDGEGYVRRIDPATNRFEGDPIPVGISATKIHAGDDGLWIGDPYLGSVIKVPYP